jgi:hypothetical protein
MKMGAPFEALLNLGEDQGSGVARRLPQVGRQKVRGSDLVAAQSQLPRIGTPSFIRAG